MTTGPSVIVGTMAAVVALSAAHSSPLAKVPVWTIATEPGAGVVVSPLFSAAV
jgi:hypothetical protein